MKTLKDGEFRASAEIYGAKGDYLIFSELYRGNGTSEPDCMDDYTCVLGGFKSLARARKYASWVNRIFREQPHNFEHLTDVISEYECSVNEHRDGEYIGIELHPKRRIKC